MKKWGDFMRLPTLVKKFQRKLLRRVNRMKILTESPQNEFWYHVSNQNEIPIAGEIQTSFDTDLLEQFLKDMPKKESEVISYIYTQLLKNPDLVDILRALVGVSDKRMYLELSYIFSKTLKKDLTVSLCGCSLYNLNRHPLGYFKNLIESRDNEVCKKSTELIGNYFLERGIFVVLKTLATLSGDELKTIIDKLILTKETQQEEAKRRGHGAEFELAKVLHNLGCKFIPSDRHLRPMGSGDPNVDIETFEITKKAKGKTWSFDLIINDNNTNPIIFIQGLIHTSDPGQYGVNKSDETVSIKKSLDISNNKYKKSKELWGLVDGVGFSENKKDTINKMIDEFDTFLQLKSFYKVGLRLHKIGLIKIKAIKFDDDFYTSDYKKEMYDKYGSAEILLMERREDGKKLGNEVEAGKAWLYI